MDINQKGQQTFHAHINCLSCCEPLDEPKLSTDANPPSIKSISDCRLLYSNIKDISDQVNLESLQQLNLTKPCSTDGRLLTKSYLCMGWLILGSIIIQSSPVMISQYKDTSPSQHIPSITLGGISCLAIKNILKHFSLIWLIDNWELILRYQRKTNDDILITIRAYFSESSSTIWKILGPLLCHPDVREELYKYIIDFLSSSQAFLSLRSLDRSVLHLIINYIILW